MKQIMNGDPHAIAVIGKKKIQGDATYRWSDFVLPLMHRGEPYVFHNLTKRCYQVSPSLATARETVFTSANILRDSDLTLLAEDGFLVPADKDEAAYYEGILQVLRMVREKGKKKGYRSFVLLPTTACNARCVYCFEQGMKYVTMTDEVAEQTIRFMLDYVCPGEKVTLSWFGGEPLIGEKTIDRITDAMTAAGIDFKSKIVTNGSLITEALVEKMKKRWHVYALQITLDGVEEEYNSRKNYVFPYDSAYWHVLSRIKMIVDSGLYLCIRVNIDEKNIGGVKQMIDDLRPFIKYPENTTIDLVPLFEVQGRESGIAVWKELFELMTYIDSTEFCTTPHSQLKRVKLRHCMAENLTRSIAIAPDGKLYNCENLDSFESIGTVFDGITRPDLVRAFSTVEKTAEKCRGCVSLPECTTFTKCKNPSTHCKFAKREYLAYDLHRQLDKKANAASEEMAADC